MLTVDDAQWCDAASLRFLAYLVRRMDTLPVAVVASLRTGEQHEHEELVAELWLEPGSLVVRPRPLSEDATTSLVERRLGSRPAPLFVSACHRTTAGNPLLLGQLLTALADDGVRPDAAHADKVVAVGSRAVSSMVLLRLRRLPGDVVEVARAAAVLGDGASLPAVAAMSGLSEVRTAESLATLARLDIVRNEQPLAFAHPLVRDAVYRALPAADRELRHERAAAVLRESGASDEQVAAHLLLAPPRRDASVVALLATAARSAAERGAAESAVTYLRRALEEMPAEASRRDLLLQLGMLEAAVDGTAAVEHLAAAYNLHADPRARAEIAIVTAATHVFASPPGVATAFARNAEAALPEELVDQRQALIALQRISGFMHGLEDAWHTPAPHPRGDELGAQMLAATVALEALLDHLDRDTAVRMGRLALHGDRLIAVEDGLFWVNAAAVLTLCDDDLGDFWSRARTASHARGSLFAALSASLWEGFWQWRRGQLHEALACLRAALDHDRLWGGSRVGEPFARAFQIGCHLDRGDVAAARRTVDEFEDGPGFGEGGRLFLQARAQLLVAEGQCEQALETLDALDAAPMGLRITNPVWNPWRGIRAAALAGCGRLGEAMALVDEEVSLLRRWGAPSYLGRALCLRGELSAAAGVEDLRSAVDLLAGTNAAVDLAKARCALGSRPEVPDAEALPLLLEASRVAERHGALGVRDRARTALERRGQRLEPCADEGRPLTTTERRILDLSGAGLEPRDIAQRLFLTPGTVQTVLDEIGPDALAAPRSSVSQVGEATMGHGQGRRFP
jgi:tetratricopeptide (TPR) repeat protein